MRRLALAIVLLAGCATEDAAEPECYTWETELQCDNGDCVEHQLCLPCDGGMVPDFDDDGRRIYWCVTGINEPKVECTLTCEEGPPSE